MHGMPPMSSIQPETTITLNGKGSVERAPDIAMITVGVSVEAPTASAAMADQTAKMNGVFNAVKAAGIADRDMQTSNLSLNAVYDYPPNQQPKMRGYNASNQITIKVRDLKNLGRTLDAAGISLTVVGVIERVDDERTDVFLPIGAYWKDDQSTRTAHNWRVLARLRPDATLRGARAEMQAIGQRLYRQHAGEIDAVNIEVSSLLDNTVEGVRPVLLALMAAVVNLPIREAQVRPALAPA